MATAAFRPRVPAAALALILAAASLAGCVADPDTVTADLHFRVLQGQDVLSCTGAAGDAPSLAFYVSEITLIDGAGRRVPATVSPAPPWQSDGVALVKPLGDGCTEGTGNERVTYQAPAGEYTGLEFALGVPEALNHADPLQAAAPLNDMRMHWSWRTGYKFFRLDATLASGFPLALHVGATGCRSPAPVRPPATACARQNRARIALPYRVDGLTVDVQLGPLLASPAVAALSCVGSYHEQPACRDLIARFGLDADSGRCVEDCRRQAVFAPATRP